jgi:hypothetical protein
MHASYSVAQILNFPFQTKLAILSSGLINERNGIAQVSIEKIIS